MWIYDQGTGRLRQNTIFFGIGYSGAPQGKNNPAMENVRSVGPIPRGNYEITSPFNSDTHGPFAMRLEPAATNEMFGRSGFLLHGDSIEHPGCASEGCIIMPRAVREAVWASTDHQLQVV